MKVLTLGKIKTLVTLIKNELTPVEKNYFLELKGTEKTYQVPEYSQGKSFVEVFKNGFRLCESKEYTVSKNGVITLIQAEHNEGDVLHVIHKK